MGQDAVSMVSLITSLVVSFAAIGLSLYTFRTQLKDTSYSDVDKAYFDLLEIGIQHPSLRQADRIARYFDLPEDDHFRIQYESYAYMCWNVMETIYDRQVDKSARFGVSPTWLPVLVEENRLHFHWFCRNLRVFKGKFQEFVMNGLNGLTIRQGTADDLDTIYPLLQRDFPAQELKSRTQFEHLITNGEYKLYLAEHATQGTRFGYALMFEPKSAKIAWLDYLAINPQFRDAGFGTTFVNQLCEMLKGKRKGVMLEVEPPLSDDPATLMMQQRRIAFYERLGAKQLDVEYLFPVEGNPYRMLLFFRPIGKATIVRGEEIQAIVKAAYTYIHDDVRDKDATLQSFVGRIQDQRI